MLSLILAAILSSPSDRYAHNGLYVRGQLGVGGTVASSEIELTNTDVTFRGAAGWLNLEVGGAVAPGVIIFGKAFGLTVPDPTLEIGDASFDTDITGYFRGLGAGATYYFPPSNFYLTGALSLAQLGSHVENGADYDSDLGLMLHVGAGLELFVASELALGVGAELAYGGFPDDDIDSDDFVWGGGYGIVAFNVTYN